jgi:hypothetical protein
MTNKPTEAEMKEIMKEVPIAYLELESRVKFIQGKVLTTIEASISNEVQLKAVKDIVKMIFSENLTRLYNDMHPNQEMLSEYDMEREWGSVDKFMEENAEIINEALEEYK